MKTTQCFIFSWMEKLRSNGEKTRSILSKKIELITNPLHQSNERLIEFDDRPFDTWTFDFVRLPNLYCVLDYEWLVSAWTRWLPTNSIGLIGIKSAGNLSLLLLAATDFSTERSSQPFLNQNTRSPRTTAGLSHDEIYLELNIFRLFWLHKSHKATENRTERVDCHLRAQTANSERIFLRHNHLAQAATIKFALFPVFVCQVHFSPNKTFFWRNKT